MDFTNALNMILKEKKEIAASSSYINLWMKWYRGKVPSFHRYYVYNGQNKIYRTRLSMKMAKQVCEDWASLLMNEKVKIVVSNQEELDKLLLDLDFWNKANEAVEKGFALSMCALQINLSNLTIQEDESEEGVFDAVVGGNTEIELTTHTATHLVPITWKNGRCVECGFVTENTDETIVVAHLLNDEGTYDIYKRIEKRIPSSEDKENNKTTIFHTGSKEPWFVLIYPRITNNLEVDSPLPISIFGNAIDTLKAIDIKYDSYNVEFLQGKKRTYVSSKLDEVDKETGIVKHTFDPDDTVIYQLPAGTSVNGEEKSMVTNVTDELRAAAHSQAIQDELNFLSKQVGLGVDYYRFEKGRVMTATQVISEKSDTFRNMKKHEGVLEKALTTFIKSLMFASSKFTNTKFEKQDEVVIQFDDSVIEDKTTEKENDRKDVESGVLSKLEFRMKWYGEDEDTAKAKLKNSFGDVELAGRINTFASALSTGAITPLEYVKQVYPDLSDQEQIAMAEELRKNNSSISYEDLLAGGNYVPNPKE